MLGKGQTFPRLLVLLAMSIWITIFIYIFQPSPAHFSQESCEKAFDGVDKRVLQYFYVLPVLLFIIATTTEKWIVSLPFILTAFAWTVALFLRRREVWRAKEPFRLHFGRLWHVINVAVDVSNRS